MSSINRKCHCLRREKTLAMPRNMLFFDTETTAVETSAVSIEQRLKLGWAVYYQKSYDYHLEQTDWFDFTDARAFWVFLFKHVRPKQRLWVIARNIVFDFTVCKGWYFLRQAEFKLKFFHNESTTTIITVQKGNLSIVFIDSMNYFRESLEKTGQRIGLPKLKIDFKTCTNAELSRYCKRDTEIELENFKGFIRFLEKHSISRLCLTIGSTAMAAYLFGHYKSKIYIHNNKEAIDLERCAYKGGRVECSFIGELKNADYYFVDVNSLYPFVMSDNTYPVKYQKFVHRPDISTLQNLVKTHAVIADVIVQTDVPVYAVKTARTIFPVGRFRTVLTTPEIKYALDNGHIQEVNCLILYHQAAIFKSYVERFYKLRCKLKAAGNKEYEQICKLLLNSLYGKFGQRIQVWEKIGVCPHERDRCELVVDNSGGKSTMIRYLLGEIFELTGYEESFNSFPAISAHVTAYGRLYLYELMKQAGAGNFYYCDTDSLIVDGLGLYNLRNKVNPTALGLLKIEQKVSGLTVRGLKDYSYTDKQVIKGISKNAVRVEDGVYTQDKWPSFKGLLRSDDVNVYTTQKVTKILNRKYRKGVVMRDGWVNPFTLGGDNLFDKDLLPVL